MISQSPDINGGDACIDRTRIAVWMLTDLFDDGQNNAFVRVVYPDLSDAQIDSARRFYEQFPEIVAKDRARHEELYI